MPTEPDNIRKAAEACHEHICLDAAGDAESEIKAIEMHMRNLLKRHGRVCANCGKETTPNLCRECAELVAPETEDWEPHAD